MLGDILEELLHGEKNRLRSISEEIREINGGSLVKRLKGKKYYFTENFEGKEVGITKNKDRIYLLARKELLLEKLALCKRRVCALEKILDEIKRLESEGKSDIFKKYDMLEVDRIRYSEQELKWLECRDSKNPYWRESLRYDTNTGVLMRSKSERYIGNFIESKGVLYMYEPELIVGNNVYYPDFMILRPDGKIVIWEHLGLMDNVNYFNKAMNKISEYRKIGYVQHENLICTYEEDLESVESLEKIFQRFILR